MVLCRFWLDETSGHAQGKPQRTTDKADSALTQSSPESYATLTWSLLPESLFLESSSLTLLLPTSTMPPSA
jgi:hypothetical protein